MKSNLGRARAVAVGALMTVWMIVCLIAVPAGAQTAGIHRGLFLGGYNTGTGANWMIQLDAANLPTTLQTGVSPGWTIWGNVYGMTQDWDNLTVVVPGILGTLSPATLGLFHYDPRTHAIVKTLTFGVQSSLAMNNWANLALNSDGNPVTVDSSTTPPAVIEFDRFTGQWIRHPVPGLAAAGGISGCEWDRFEGGVLHASWGSPSVLYRTDYLGNTVTIAAHTARVSRYGGTLSENGDWISSTCCTDPYFLVKRGSAVWTPGPVVAGTVATEVTHEKYAAASRGLWLYNENPAQLVKHLDLRTNSVTTVFNGTMGSVYEVLPLEDNDLATVRTGKGTWLLSINPGQGALAGKPFLAAASLVPARPGVVLPDGREIYIGLDFLTLVTVGGALPPFLTGNSGTLDATGAAMARIDFSSVGTAVNGSVIHFCAVVFDPAAPLGIAWVCDPFAFVIHVIP